MTALRVGQTIFQRIAMTYDASVYKAALLAVKLTKNRIQNSGTAVDGQRLLTKSKKPIGAYSQWHGKDRQKKGLQTAYVDATYTGALMRSFGVLDYRGKQGEIGVNDSLSAEKIQELEDLYGTEIFAPSADDEEKVMDLFENEIFKELDKLFA